MRSSQVADFATRSAAAATYRSPVGKLYVQVLIAIALGILLGHFYPSLGVDMKPLSDAFITLIRAVVPVIIFATVAAGIAKMGDMRRVASSDCARSFISSSCRPWHYWRGSPSATCSSPAPAFTSILRIWTRRRLPAT